MNAYSIGVLYELKAARYLRRQGCRVIARRYRAADGEIDLIARDGDTLAFIEVKARPDARLGSFELIVCNPPYIPAREIAELDGSVRDYEPALALDGGDDGLRFYRAILGAWKSLLRQGGWICFEVGETQADDVEKLMRLASLRALGRAKDTAGYDRVVYGRL